MHISKINPDEFGDLLILWESSVRATHHFLSEDDIQYLRPLVRSEALPNLTLRGIRNNNGEIIGFIGISEDSVETLFVSPNYFGQGLGTALMRYAEKQFNTAKVDVNEQNPAALTFYEKLGYTIVGRSPLDGQGRAFPLLHLKKNI